MDGIGHTSPIYYLYLLSSKASAELYCLAKETHVCEQLDQDCYMIVERLGVKPVTQLS